MSAIARPVPPTVRRPRPALVVMLLAAAVIIGLSASAVWFGRPSEVGLTMPTSPAVEARWGIRLTHVGVTADGGLVDVRFQVLDSDRALAMMQDPANLPILQSEVDGRKVGSAALMSGKHELAPGRSSFLLYRNMQDAIVAGQPLRLIFDDLVLEHVPAE